MNVFSIRDLKAEAYNRPFFSLTRATAMREIAVGLQNDRTMSAFAADFALYEIGSFDSESGTITSQLPYHVCAITDLTVPADQADGPEALHGTN